MDDFRGGGAGAAVDAGGGAEVEGWLDSGNGVWFASMLGHVCEGLVNGSDAYGGGMVIPNGDSIGMTGGGP